jgi:DNA-binding MarR family transcriptional regulator
MSAKINVSPKMKILEVLATNKEFKQYSLPKATGFSYRTILRALKPMEKAGWIRLVRTEASEKGGKEKKIYTLTLKGLMNIFGVIDLSKFREPKLSEWIDKAAENSGYLLPLVLGKWHYYKTRGLEVEFMEAFQWVLWHYLKLGFNTKAFATERFWYYIFVMTKSPSKEKWIKAMRRDPELRQWAIDEMKDWLREGRNFIGHYEKSLEYLEMPSEPDWTIVMNELRFHAPKESKYSKPLSDEELSNFLE